MALSEFIPGIHIDKQELIRYQYQARLLRLDITRGARSILAGNYRSRFRGRGMEFAESRQYQPGDDRRHIDWRVTARTGITHTKLFIEEKERPVFIVIDYSASLYFGTRDTFKSVLAAKAATLLAWTAMQQGDRVGAVLMNSGRVIDLKPKSGRSGVLALINALSHMCEDSALDPNASLLNACLNQLCTVVHPGSLIFLFSDFYQIDGLTKKLLAQAREHNDIVACRLLDPLELKAPIAGRYSVTDGDGQAVLNTHSRKVTSRYDALFRHRQHRLESLASSLKIPVMRFVNGQDFQQVVIDAFGAGKRTGKRV